MQMLYLLARTTSFRQASCVAFVFLLVALGAVACGQDLLESVMVRHVREMITAEIHTQQLMGGLERAERLAAVLGEREAVMGRIERAVSVQAPSGAVLYGAAVLLSPRMCPLQQAPCHGWMRAGDAGHEWLGYGLTLGDGGRYVIAYDIQPMLDRVSPVPMAGGAGIFLVLLVSLATGLRFSLSGLRRVDQIRQAMRRFVLGDQLARVPLTGRHDEFDRLSGDINHALSRIDRLMQEVRSATNHIAHELRTPLTRLQHRLSNIAELSVGHPAIRDEVERAEDEARQIQQLFRAVMRISEIETGRCEHERAWIDVHALFDDLSAYYQGLAEHRSMRLAGRIEPGLAVEGDRALLFQALVNLVDNAFKYASGAGQTITLVAWRHGARIELGVGDQGPGIEAGLRSQAVQRFRRLTRSRSIPGHGLGLALVQAVADLHGGALVLTDHFPDGRGDGASEARGAVNAGAAQPPATPGLLALLCLPARGAEGA
ncbi:MAG: HAMP domain-containing sensor histidine kinase [Xenophilus sp.]